jgi:hypothetical protein
MTIRDIGNGPEFRETRSIDLDGMSIDRVVEYLNEKAEGLSDPVLSIECGGYYGDTIVEQTLSGWRKATDAEIQKDAADRAQTIAQQRQWEERQAETLRKTRPDLFK